MRPLLLALALVLGAGGTAQGAPRLVVSAPASAPAGTTVSVKLSGPKTGKVRVFVLTGVTLRKADRPAAQGALRRGKATLKVRIPSTPRTYRLIACLQRSKGKLQCAAARKLRAVAPAAKPVVVPAAPAPAVPAPAPPGPLALTLAGDAGRAASASIGPAGGQVVATSATGVEYRLTVPVGALAAFETITLTPSSTMTSLPVDPIGGVLLAPEGLVVLKDVDLAITPTAAPAPAQALAFGAAADGTGVHLVPLTLAGGAIHVALHHFSAIGAGTGGAAAVQALLAAAPMGEEDIAQHESAVAHAQFARGSIGQAGLEAALRAALARWLAAVEPAVRAAEADDTAFDAATIDYLAWQGAVQHSGLDFTTDRTRLADSHRRAVTHAFDRAFTRCLAGEYERMGRLLLLRQLNQSLGYGLPLDGERLVRCGRFEVERDVSFADNYDAYTIPGIWVSTAGSTTYQTNAPGIDVVYTPGDTELRGTGAMTAGAFAMTGFQTGIGNHCDQQSVARSIGAPGWVTVAVDLPVNLRHGAVPGTLVRVVASEYVALHYDIVRTKNGNPCNATVASIYPGGAGAAQVPITGATTGSVHAAVTGTISGATAQYRTTTDTTVTLAHLPCAPATPIASC